MKLSWSFLASFLFYFPSQFEAKISIRACMSAAELDANTVQGLLKLPWEHYVHVVATAEPEDVAERGLSSLAVVTTRGPPHRRSAARQEGHDSQRRSFVTPPCFYLRY